MSRRASLVSFWDAGRLGAFERENIARFGHGFHVEPPAVFRRSASERRGAVSPDERGDVEAKGLEMVRPRGKSRCHLAGENNPPFLIVDAWRKKRKGR